MSITSNAGTTVSLGDTITLTYTGTPGASYTWRYWTPTAYSTSPLPPPTIFSSGSSSASFTVPSTGENGVYRFYLLVQDVDNSRLYDNPTTPFEVTVGGTSSSGGTGGGSSDPISVSPSSSVSLGDTITLTYTGTPGASYTWRYWTPTAYSTSPLPPPTIFSSGSSSASFTVPSTGENGVYRFYLLVQDVDNSRLYDNPTTPFEVTVGGTSSSGGGGNPVDPNGSTGGTLPPPVGSPQSLILTAGYTTDGLPQITATWSESALNGNTSVTKYNVYLNGSFNKELTTTSTTIVVPAFDTTYNIYVKAVGNLNTTESNSSTTEYLSVPTPTVVAVSATVSGTSVTLNWISSPADYQWTSYYILNSATPNTVYSGTATSTTITGLEPGTYTFEIDAYRNIPDFGTIAVNTTGRVLFDPVTISAPPPPAAPIITSQPVPIPGEGNQISLIVTAEAASGISSALTYQWYKGTSVIAGATSRVYTITNVTTSSAGDYKVLVSYSSYPSIYTESSVATVIANVLPVGVPDSPTLTAGASQITVLWDHVAANGNNIVTYTVNYKRTIDSTMDYTSETTTDTTYTITGLDNGIEYEFYISAAGDIDATIRIGNGSTESTWDLPEIIEQPDNATVSAGSTFTLSVSASKGNFIPQSTDLIYQWFKDGSAIEGATNNSYTVISSSPSDAGVYVVRIGYSGYSLTAGSIFTQSDSVQVTVNQPTAPTEPTAPTALSKNTTYIDLSWTAPADNGIPITSYIVEKSTNNVDWLTAETVTSTTTRVTGLLPDTTYYLRVIAVNNSENLSIPSDSFSMATDTLAPSAQFGTDVATSDSVSYDGINYNITTSFNSSDLDTPLVDAGTTEPVKIEIGTTTHVTLSTNLTSNIYNGPDSDAQLSKAIRDVASTTEKLLIVTSQTPAGDQTFVASTIQKPISGSTSPDVTAQDPTKLDNSTIKASTVNLPAGARLAIGVRSEINGNKDLIMIKAVDNDGNVINLATKNIPITYWLPTSRVTSGSTVKRSFTLTHYNPSSNTPQKSVLYRNASKDNGSLLAYTGIINVNQIHEGEPSDELDPTTICFLGNTPIQTPTGYRRIDSLSVGDKVLTADGRAVVIQRIAKQRCEPSAAANPYVIPTGQFGATQNVLISPNHRVAVAGHGMIEARDLGLRQMPMRASFDYYNLELPNWETDNMVAAGVEAESLAPVRRIEISKAEFLALLRVKYGRLTPGVISRAARACFMTAEGKVNIPVLKKQATK